MFIQAAEAKGTMPHIATLKTTIYDAYVHPVIMHSPSPCQRQGWEYLAVADLWRREDSSGFVAPTSRVKRMQALHLTEEESQAALEGVPAIRKYQKFLQIVCLFLFAVRTMITVYSCIPKLSLYANSCKEYMPISCFSP